MEKDVNSTRKSTLKREIEQAFAEVPYPGDDRIVEACIIDGQDLNDPDRQELADDLRGKHWRHVDLETLLRHDSSLPYLTTAGLHFFLPAYLLGALEIGSRDDAAGNLLYLLVIELDCREPAPGTPDLRAQWLSRYGKLSVNQREAVKHFLEYVRDCVYRSDVEWLNSVIGHFWAKEPQRSSTRPS
jgi:hypothetical protein